MPKILLVTVGGSPQPILTAIEALQPDRVIFICSDGSKGSKTQIIGNGTPCEIRRGEEVKKLPNIPTYLGLSNFHPDTDLILIQPDDLSECYRQISSTIRTLQQDFPNYQILVDYTGGTKTMSAALAMAGIDYDLNLHITTSTTRENLFRVERGETTERASTIAISVERKIEQFLPLLLQQYNYAGAIAELKNILQLELPNETKQRIRILRDCCAGFDAWDRFAHVDAWDLLQSYMKKPEIQPSALFLKRVMHSRAAIDEKFKAPDGIKGHGYEVVQDLLLNAERRATQERYDDAVGRLYRAIELLAQIRLWQAYKVKTGDVDLQNLPESLHADLLLNCDRGKIQLALTQSYLLLSKLPDEPLGKAYQEQAAKIQDVLQIRNYSILAHGFQPITKTDYQKFSGVVVSFIQNSIAMLVPEKQQFQPVQFLQNLNF
ncbi:TIGR02710 family CRISPR-associated CARF protein [Scytonema millei]|uniref:TIGR02710 family CRISPR-associated protein n=1 Tax=Scytonema millei VB511283 TaxID=1245923 RepID=A0A9X5E323_9CYAN|nr:TIGR02710 family CRISPR-associated CARF protein [Scytonema millei]NHC34315.1 TIGR02710 family CRISPR-associated protein [Scytonema millei VB511283]